MNGRLTSLPVRHFPPLILLECKCIFLSYKGVLVVQSRYRITVSHGIHWHQNVIHMHPWGNKGTWFSITWLFLSCRPLIFYSIQFKSAKRAVIRMECFASRLVIFERQSPVDTNPQAILTPQASGSDQHKSASMSSVVDLKWPILCPVLL